MSSLQIQVGIDVGSRSHRVAVAVPAVVGIEEFDITHDQRGFGRLFGRLETLEQTHRLPVAVAMEGYNGHARPLDREIQARGWRLFNVNNLKLARYKEIFPAPAKTDAIDARRILELFRLSAHVPLAREVLQEVTAVPLEHDQLKRLTRRRRQLVEDKVRLVARLYADLQAVCPGLVEITGEIDNLWFLNLLTCRAELSKLATLRAASLRALPGVGAAYAARIHAWQKTAVFAPEVAWVGPMIIADANRVLELKAAIKALAAQIAELVKRSELAQTLDSVPGFGTICSAELAGEIGSMTRFGGEASLALYVGMAALDHSSGQHTGTRSPRQVNTRAKAAMMVALARHVHCVPASRAYYERKRAEGKRHNQALRCLGRHMVRVIWALVKQQRHYEIRPNKA
jgi:transposase